MNNDRRTLLGLSAGLAASAFFGFSKAFASVEEVQKAITDFAGDVTPEAGGALKLTTPEIAENGNSVPVAVMVESPMTEDDYIESVMILAEGNPNPEVVSFNFTPASGKAAASTRMRLAKTQNVLAVAKTSQGKFFSASNNVKVTIGGCGG